MLVCETQDAKKRKQAHIGASLPVALRFHTPYTEIRVTDDLFNRICEIARDEHLQSACKVNEAILQLPQCIGDCSNQ